MIAVTVGLVAIGSVKVSRAYTAEIMTSAKSLVEAQVRKEINVVVLPLVKECTQKERIVTLSTSPNTSIDLDGPKLAQLVGEAMLAMQNDLDRYEKLTLTLPRGALIGSTYLADKGREVDYHVTSHYTTQCRYTTSLECVGINRVRYAVYLVLIVEAKIIVPLSSDTITVSQYIPVCEHVFAGEVPNVYVNGEEGTNYLDLIP